MEWLETSKWNKEKKEQYFWYRSMNLDKYKVDSIKIRQENDILTIDPFFQKKQIFSHHIA